MLSEMLEVKHLLKVQSRRLSLGERMKMEIIAALIHNPQVLFLDEPTIGLDIVTQKKLHEFLSHYNLQYKATILLTSHYVNDIENLCKRSIIVDQGKIVFDGKTKDMDARIGKNKYIKVRVGSNTNINGDLLGKLGMLKEKTDTGFVVEVNSNDVRQVLQVIYDEMDIEDLSIENISLEEALSNIYTHKGNANE
jgi:ABC-2 type transport system ATP-binding protein